MTYTEHYVSVTGAGAHDGTIGDDWTLAEFITASSGLGASDRVNVAAGSYSHSSGSVDADGTVAALFCIRGYNSSIGDLEGQGWNSDGTLNVTNYPVIDCSGTFDMSAGTNHILLQNLSFTGSINGMILGNGAADRTHLIEVKVLNTANNSSALAVNVDDSSSYTNCDFECSGASHGIVAQIDGDGRVVNCRFKGIENAKILLDMRDGAIIGCHFIGAASTTVRGINIGSVAINNSHLILGNTFYGLATAVTFLNSANTGFVLLEDNHVTDCDVWLDSAYSGTRDIPIFEINTRIRDVATHRIGIGDGADINEISTDTGGIETDFVDAGSGDFHLINSAPGEGTGARGRDIGAYKAEDPAGGGGGLLIHPGMTGGIRG